MPTLEARIAAAALKDEPFTLEMLVGGPHQLDAVDFDAEARTPTSTWDEEIAQVMRFRLNDVVYACVEDPEDGYRSSMRDLHPEPHGQMTNVFPPVEVVGRMKANSDTGWCEKNNVLELVVVSTGKVVLEAGTANTDDYYPMFIARFDPTAMVGPKFPFPEIAR